MCQCRKLRPWGLISSLKYCIKLGANIKLSLEWNTAWWVYLEVCTLWCKQWRSVSKRREIFPFFISHYYGEKFYILVLLRMLLTLPGIKLGSPFICFYGNWASDSSRLFLLECMFCPTRLPSGKVVVFHAMLVFNSKLSGFNEGVCFHVSVCRY